MSAERQLGAFAAPIAKAIAGGLAAVALVDRHGRALATAGALDAEDATPLFALVIDRLKTQRDRTARLFAGEVVALELHGLRVAIGIAGRQLFVIAVLLGAPGALGVAQRLRDEVSEVLDEPIPANVTGTAAVELALLEYGIPAGRVHAKA